MSEAAIIALLLFLGGALLAFLGWIAVSINRATAQLSSLRTSVDRILDDLDGYKSHGAQLAVLQSRCERMEDTFQNYAAETNLELEKLRDTRYEKSSLHRR